MELNVIMIGVESSGKTELYNCLTNFRYIFQESNIPTNGVEFTAVSVSKNTNFYELSKIKLWDTAGKESYQTIVKGYLVQKDFLLCVIDVTQDINMQLKYCKEMIDNLDEKCTVVFALSKCDQTFNLTTLKASIELFKTNNQSHFFAENIYQTSAKNNDKEMLFEFLKNALLQKVEQQNTEKFSNISLDIEAPNITFWSKLRSCISCCSTETPYYTPVNQK